MGKKSEKGNVIEIVIIGVLVLAVAGLLVWRFIGNNNTKNAANTPQSSATASVPSTTGKEEQTTGGTENTTNMSTSNPNEGYIVIDDWGVRFKYSGSGEVQYYKNGQAYSFTTAAAKKIAGCSEQPFASLGSLSRSTESSTMTETSLNNGAKIGDYYYYYSHPQFMCAEKDADSAFIQAQTNAIKDMLATIEAKQ